jgi:hypothetical protein
MDSDLDENNLSNIEEEEELDEETKRILWEANLRRLNNKESDFVFIDDTKKLKQKKSNDKKNKKNVLSLEEFSKKVEEDEKLKQPKKFVSKRVEEKKKVNEENTIKRTFNARLPPYNWVHQTKKEQVNVNINDEHEFPSL